MLSSGIAGIVPLFLRKKNGAMPDVVAGVHRQFHLTSSVQKVVFQKAIHAQIRQLFLYIGNDKG